MQQGPLDASISSSLEGDFYGRRPSRQPERSGDRRDEPLGESSHPRGKKKREENFRPLPFNLKT